METEIGFEVKQCIIEWTLQKSLHHLGHQRSPYFPYQGSEYYILMSHEEYNQWHSPVDYYYIFFIYCKTGYGKKFQVTVNILNGADCISSRRSTVFSTEAHQYFICEFSRNNISKEIPNFEKQSLLHFRIILGENLPSTVQKVNSDKSVQTTTNFYTSPCLQSLSDDFSKLLADEAVSSCDVVELKFGDEIFRAHKSILSTRSEVFSAMLKTDMLESRTGSIEVSDMASIRVLKIFLKYLYTGTLPDISVADAKQLYKVGDKYAVKSLMKRCSVYLSENLTENNVCEILALADTHSDNNLKETVISYILDKKIHLNNDIWLPFCNGHPVVAVEVLNQYCMLQNKNE